MSIKNFKLRIENLQVFVNEDSDSESGDKNDEMTDVKKKEDEEYDKEESDSQLSKEEIIIKKY